MSICAEANWVMVVIDPPRNNQAGVHSHGPIVGTEEQARELVEQAADSWGHGQRLGIAQIIEPTIVKYGATVTWTGEPPENPCICGCCDGSDCGQLSYER